MTTAERFWAKVAIGAPDECWPWLGARDRRGYGRFMLRGRNEHAHRVALALDGRPAAPRKDYACHHCDNPPCCNPRHLYVGNASTNGLDALRRGLRVPNPLRGERHPGARLTERLVQLIRARYHAGGVNQYELAAEYGVSQSTIGRVVRRRLWTHV